MNKPLKPGIHYDMPIDGYHANTSTTSKTILDRVDKSPAHCRYAMDNPEGAYDSDAMLKGRAFHSLMEGKESFVVWTGKTRRGKAWDEFKLEHEGVDIITQAQAADVNSMADAVKSHPHVPGLLKHGRPEVTAVAEIDGILCKARADLLIESGPYAGALVDWKTTRDASEDGAYKATSGYRYDVQAAFYMEVFRRAGANVSGVFYFVMVEITAPHLVQIYELDVDILEAGYRAYTKDLETLKRCRESGIWPGYSEDKVCLLEARPYGRMAPVNNLTWGGEEVLI